MGCLSDFKNCNVINYCPALIAAAAGGSLIDCEKVHMWDNQIVNQFGLQANLVGNYLSFS